VVRDSSKDRADSESWTACRFSTVRRTVLPRSPGPLVGSRQFKGLWCLRVLDCLSVLDSLKDRAALESWTTCWFSAVWGTVVPQSPGLLIGSRQYEGLWCLRVLDRFSVLDSMKDRGALQSWTACQFSTVRRTVVPQSPGLLVGSRQYEGLW
jgi:hypothetical protein